ncbi:MAG: hypothetical protein AB7I30_04420 [Isosphaeraceae bacterium]
MLYSRIFLLAWLIGQNAPAVRLPSADDPRGVFEAVGLDAETLAQVAADPSKAPAIFRVTTVGPGDRPALFGTYRVSGKSLQFAPRFPMEPGVTYRAVLHPPGGSTPILADLAIPDRPVVSSTRVVRVSPTAGVLPENLLKFYVEFSAPMGRGEAYEHLSLLDAQGDPIDLPFLELGEELWTPDGRRFTILFDPGRIKSGLRPREEAGPVLEKGESYTLVIDRGWRDAAGGPLVESYRKAFRVGPADHEPPDPAGWSVGSPEPGTRSALVVRFPEPLDRAMLGRVLGVSGPDGQGLPGRATVGDDETSWVFVPDRPWLAGDHRLLVDRSLEDRAGNTIGRPFEVDVFEKVDRATTPAIVTRRFRVGR